MADEENINDISNRIALESNPRKTSKPILKFQKSVRKIAEINRQKSENTKRLQFINKWAECKESFDYNSQTKKLNSLSILGKDPESGGVDCINSGIDAKELKKICNAFPELKNFELIGSKLKTKTCGDYMAKLTELKELRIHYLAYGVVESESLPDDFIKNYYQAVKTNADIKTSRTNLNPSNRPNLEVFQVDLDFTHSLQCTILFQKFIHRYFSKPNLRSLDLSHCTNITDPLLKTIFCHHGTSLERLDLGFCKASSEHFVKFFTNEYNRSSAHVFGVNTRNKLRMLKLNARIENAENMNIVTEWFTLENLVNFPDLNYVDFSNSDGNLINKEKLEEVCAVKPTMRIIIADLVNCPKR